jgi:hypothetical protein
MIRAIGSVIRGEGIASALRRTGERIGETTHRAALRRTSRRRFARRSTSPACARFISKEWHGVRFDEALRLIDDGFDVGEPPSANAAGGSSD